MALKILLRAFVALSVLSVAVAFPDPTLGSHKHANNLVTLPLARHHNFTGVRLLESDQTRAKHLKTQRLSGSKMVDIENAATTTDVDITNSAMMYAVDVCMHPIL